MRCVVETPKYRDLATASMCTGRKLRSDRRMARAVFWLACMSAPWAVIWSISARSEALVASVAANWFWAFSISSKEA